MSTSHQKATHDSKAYEELNTAFYRQYAMF